MMLALILLYFFMFFCLWMAIPKRKKLKVGGLNCKKSSMEKLNNMMAWLGTRFPLWGPKGRNGKSFPLPIGNIRWESFYGYKITSALLSALASIIPARTFMATIIFGAGGLVLGFWVPDLIVRMEINKRNKNMLADLPYILDLLYISTLSGQNIYKSMEILVQNYDGEVCRQFIEFIEHVKFGRGKDDAYRSLAQKPNPAQLKDIFNLLQVTENCGANISGILKQKSSQLKFEISQEVERRSRKVSLMILFPLALLVLPSFVLMVGGPLIYTISGDFLIF